MLSLDNMYYVCSGGLIGTDSYRASDKSTGKVAARIQAFQTGWHANHEPISRIAPRRTLTLTNTGDSGIVVGRGRRREPSFAPPASRVMRDGSEGSRGDTRSPVGQLSGMIHPACEEKEVYFRPFSRVSRQSTSRGSERDDICSPRSLHSPDLIVPLQSSVPVEHGDGTTELLAARSRLRSITERKESEGRAEQAEDLTLADLGSMLDDAIGDSHASLSGDPNQLPHNQIRQPSPGPNPSAGSFVRSKDEDMPERNAVDNNESPPPAIRTDSASVVLPEACSEVGLTTEQEKIQAPDVPLATDLSLQGGLRKVEQKASIFRRYSFRAQDTMRKAKDTEDSVDRLEPGNGTPKPLASPVKERTALFEKPTGKRTQLNLGQSILKPNDFPPKADWSQYQRSHERKASRPIRTFMHHRRASSNPKGSSALIPLTLPQMVKHDSSRERASDILIDQPRSPVGVEAHLSANTPAATSALAKAVEEKLDIHQKILESAERLKEGLTESRTSNLPDRSPNNSRPSKWTLLQRNQESRKSVQPITPDAEPKPNQLSRSARSSIVESKIRDLLAASKQKGIDEAAPRRNTVDFSKVREGVLFEGVGDMKTIDSKKVAGLQLPIGEQVGMTTMTENPASDTNSHTPTRVMKTNGRADQVVHLSTQRAASPTKTASVMPGTPTRGRSNKVKQSLSPRGLPYAIEQRFSLSPSRSRSRHGGNGLFVSVEVRSSPEKSKNGSDEHQVIVRASVEPDDITDDSEE